MSAGSQSTLGDYGADADSQDDDGMRTCPMSGCDKRFSANNLPRHLEDGGTVVDCESPTNSGPELN